MDQYDVVYEGGSPVAVPPAAGGGVAFGNSDINETANQATAQVNGFDATGSNRLGIAYLFWRTNAGQQLQSITWGGVNMTDCGVGTLGGSGFIAAQMFYIKQADMGSGAKNIIATLNASSVRMSLHVMWLTAVNQATPIGTPVTAVNDGAAAWSEDVATDANSLAVAGINVLANEAVNSDNTTIEAGAPHADGTACTGRASGTGADVAMGFNWTSSGRSRFIAANVKAA